MNYRSIRIGRFFGIELRLDYSWFVLFLLVAWSLTFGVLPAIYSQLSVAETIITGIAATLLLFFSVVVHEFAHSLYAKKIGLRINRITLFIFGGAAELQDEPKNPKQEFVMAGLGPLTSIGIGVLFGAVWLLGAYIHYTPLEALGGILASANIMLAIFNLVPGFPLDGGRMFRAIAWKLSGNLLKATRIAAIVGKGFALLLFAYGLLQLVVIGNLGGIWLILVAYFLYRAAAVSYEQTVAQMLLKDVRVADLMTESHITVPGATEAKDFLHDYVLKHKLTTLPVQSSKDKTVGMVSAEDASLVPPHTRVEQFAVNGEFILHPQDPAVKALHIMANSTLQKVPVVENGKIIGILSIENLRSYLFGMHKTTLSR